MNQGIQNDMNELVQLSYFAEIGKAIVAARTLRETLQAVMDHIGEFFTPLNWSLLLRDPKSGKLRFELVIGSGMESLKGKEISSDLGIAGWVFQNGRSAIVADVSKDERFSKQIDVMTGFTTKSIVAVPLISREKVFGVIELVNKINGDSFTAMEMKVLTTIADFTAIAVEKHYYLAALRRVATIDPLTKVYNRRYFDLSLERERARSIRTGKPFSILMVDINHFKDINDKRGHAAGDEVLKQLARLLIVSVRRMDIVCRIGGDEFAVLLPETDRETAEAVAGRLRQSLSEQNSRSVNGFEIAIGIGVKTDRSSGDPSAEADRELYLDKARRFELDTEDVRLHIKELYEDEGENL